MAITAIKIHPAIGVARLGNSPDEFFIGPERLWDPPEPPDGFKDSKCRVKRQAARFRLFAYHDDASISEVTDQEAEISWTVHLANRKAVARNPGAGAGAMTIDPGPRTLNAPDQRKLFDNGKIEFPGASAATVPLGEARTDDTGRLLVLGGFGKSASPTNQSIGSFLDNAGWYDDIADGPVKAHVKLRATGEEIDAAGAWVLVAPPKFAPQLDSVVTLHDRLFQMAADQGWVSAPPTPSYTNDIYPILRRARTTEFVRNVYGAHAWPDPAYEQAIREAIFTRLANPAGGGGDMPRLNQVTLTKTQYASMKAWRDDSFTRDWAGPPTPSGPLTPQELDRAALTAGVGAAFYPGIEAGGIAGTPIVDASNYVGASDPMRLDQSGISAGDMSRFMALPWQADFYACGAQWWPVPRPNEVIPQSGGGYLAWDRDIGSYLDMVEDWHTLGFVVRQGDGYVEVDRCDTPFITLLTPHLHFQDVPQGPMGMARKVPLAVAFEVKSTGAAVTLEVGPGGGPAHPRLTIAVGSTTVGPTTGNEIITARLWVFYETGPLNESINDQLTVREPASGKTWTVTITANTVARKTSAAALILDRSGSMSEDRGDGQSKHQGLKEAASIFVDVMLEGDGIGIVRYNEDAQPLQAITALGPAGDPFDPARQATKDVIAGTGLNPDGSTSIGDGIYEGRSLLNAAGGSFDVRSLVVLTDGVENTARYIAEVAPQINELTYAIGLGTPENTSAPALQTISGNHGGYLLVTGAIAGDNRFRLQKYFLQILAGISNAEVVLDPDGVLTAGHEQRIPFQLTEADAGVDVILLTEEPEAVDFRLQTPTGFVLQPWQARVEPTMAWTVAPGIQYYRLALPTELARARFDQAGTWHVLLSVGKPRTDRPEEGELDGELGPPIAPAIAEEGGSELAARRGSPYSVIVHSYSNIVLSASLTQSSFEPGAEVTLEANLAESGIPASLDASAWAEVAQPDGTVSTVPLPEAFPGRFKGSFPASASGIHRCRIRASGRSPRGYPFQRERTLTAAVWKGGDRDAELAAAGTPAGGRRGGCCAFCRWLKRLLGLGPKD